MSDDCLNFLAQTATLRFSPKWEDVRSVLGTRGVDSHQTVLFGCDHAGGDDMALWLALSDGKIVNCVLREERSARRYSSVAMWRTVIPDSDEELLLASHVASDQMVAGLFNHAVESFRKFVHAASLPPSA